MCSLSRRRPSGVGSCFAGLLPAWSGNLKLFAFYWLATTVIFLVSRRSERIVLGSGMAVVLFDAPIVFFLQWATFPTSNPSGVAGFTVGV